MAKSSTLAMVTDPETIPAAVLVGGRGQTGKTVTIRLLYELVTARGGDLTLCDVDRSNQSLSAYEHLRPSIKRPVSAEDNDVSGFLNGIIDGVIEDRRTAIFDMGGGDQMLKTWSRDLELAPFLESHGCRPVHLHLILPDPDGLSYLRDIENKAKFQPAATALIINEGVVLPGQSVGQAYEPILTDPIFQAAVARGAEVMRLTRLACMPAVNKLRVSFTEAMAGAVVDGRARLGPVDRQLVTLWLRENAANLAKVLQWM